MKIVPSLVEQSAATLFDRITYLSPYFHRFQIDIEDGVFVKNKTLSTKEFVDYFTNLPAEALAKVGPTVFDFHLMVYDPETHLKILSKFPQKQIGVVFIHKSVFPPLKQLTTSYPHFTFGLVLNPEDKVDAVDSALINRLSDIQIMTVDPGRQGQPFIPEALQKIEQLRKREFTGKIYIDGAVNELSIPIILSLSHKPDILCPGSYLAQSPRKDLEKRVRFLSGEA